MSLGDGAKGRKKTGRDESEHSTPVPGTSQVHKTFWSSLQHPWIGIFNHGKTETRTGPEGAPSKPGLPLGYPGIPTSGSLARTCSSADAS